MRQGLRLPCVAVKHELPLKEQLAQLYAFTTTLSQNHAMTADPLALEPLLTEVRARSSGIGSHIHGELHWRTVGANGLWLAEPLDQADTFVCSKQA